MTASRPRSTLLPLDQAEAIAMATDLAGVHRAPRSGLAIRLLIAALPGGAHHRGRRVRDPRASGTRLGDCGGGDHGARGGSSARSRSSVLLAGLLVGRRPRCSCRHFPSSEATLLRRWDHRRDRHAARDLPALGADAAARSSGVDEERAPPDLPLRADRRRDRDGHRRRDQHGDAERRRPPSSTRADCRTSATT